MEDIEFEIWKDITDYEGLYQISSYGRVKSLAGKIIRKGAISKEIILKNNINELGYYHVILYKNYKAKTCRIHQLVAIHFLNHKPDGTQIIIVDHINNDKLNNHVSNLQLISQRHNVIKSINKKNKSSEYPGVFWNKQNNKWRSQIEINRKKKHLGYFENELDASNAYQLALNCL